MCGRFLLDCTPEDLATLSGSLSTPVPPTPAFAPRYNIAPTQRHLLLGRPGQAHGAGDELVWGFYSFGLTRNDRTMLLNARSESAHRLPTFRQAWRERRCVASATGFYEWRRPSGGGRKEPFLIREAKHRPFGLAALAVGDNAFVIVTTAATTAMAAVHDRMPTMLLGDRLEAWLDGTTQPRVLNQLCAPESQPTLELTTIGTYVNSPRHDDAECVAPHAQA